MYSSRLTPHATIGKVSPPTIRVGGQPNRSHTHVYSLPPSDSNKQADARSTGSTSNRGPAADASTSDSAPQLNLLDPVQTIAWGGSLPGPRRAILGGLTAATIALGGNLGGITGFLLGLDGGRTAATWGLDILIPVAGHKRYVDYKDGYEFTYPAEWLGDQTLMLRAAQRAESSRSLDPPALDPLGGSRRRPVAEPSTAFGPAGTTGEENVSVIVAPIYQGFDLRSLGSPEDAAHRFLDTIALPGSGKTTKLFAADERTDAASGQLYYTVEYLVRGPRFERHNCSVYTARKALDGVDLLFTFNAQCPETAWEADRALLQASAASFQLTARVPLPQRTGRRSPAAPSGPSGTQPLGPAGKDDISPEAA